jgi:hypothetical protein
MAGTFGDFEATRGLQAERLTLYREHNGKTRLRENKRGSKEGNEGSSSDVNWGESRWVQKVVERGRKKLVTEG